MDGKLEVKLEAWNYGLSNNPRTESLLNPKQFGLLLLRGIIHLHRDSSPLYQATIPNLPSGERRFTSKDRSSLAADVLYEARDLALDEIHVIVDNSFIPERNEEARQNIVDKVKYAFNLYEAATGTKVTYEIPNGSQ